MTIRRTRTLHARLREQEELHVAEARDVMLAMSSVVAAMTRFPSRPVVADNELLAVLGQARVAVFDQGVLLLRKSSEMNLTAVGRDLVAIEATLEKKYDGMAMLAFDSLDVAMTLANFEEDLDVKLGVMWVKMVDELGKQQGLASSYDEDVEEGTTERWTKTKPVRRYGRKGKGVIPGFVGGTHYLLTNGMWGMVNAQRSLMFQSAQKVVENVG